MSNYIPHHTKKLEILQSNEDALRRLISRGASESALVRMAGKIRAARVRVLRVKQSLILPNGLFDKELEEVAAQIERQQKVPTFEILAEFGVRPPESREPNGDQKPPPLDQCVE